LLSRLFQVQVRTGAFACRINPGRAVVAISLVLLLAALFPAAAATRIDRHVTVDGMDRRYVAYLPDNYQQKGALPVVLAFHGGFGDSDQFADLTGLAAAPEARNFIIAFPEGYRRSWNEGGVCCGQAMGRVDDVKFVRTLLNDLDRLTSVDRRRIYATGWSNGGGMSYYLACVMSEEITAIAPVSAAMRQPKSACHPMRPVPVFDWHGLLDHISPYAGGATTAARSVSPPPPVPETIAFWTQLDGTRNFAHLALFGGQAECDMYSGGRDDAKVQSCRIAGMGHRWPGTRSTARTERGDAFIRTYVGDLGPYAPEIDANDAILKFFREFALPTAPNR
jgi:polyhydroxybutyrate depolymerase